MSNKFKVILGSSTKFYRGFVGAILSLSLSLSLSH